MGGEDHIHGDLVVFEEPVSPHGPRPRAAGFGDGGLGTIIEVLGDRVKACLEARVVETDRAELFLGPVRRLLWTDKGKRRLLTQDVLPVRREGIDKDLLFLPVPAPCAFTDTGKIGGLVTGAGKGGINEGFHEDGTDMVALFPVIGHAGEDLDRRKDQEAVVTDYLFKAGPSRPLGPSDVAVSALQGPRRGS